MTPSKHERANHMHAGNELNDSDDAAAQDSAVQPRPSKSALKRQMHALQAMGEHLATLPLSRLEQMPVSAGLRDAISQFQQIKPRAREGRRRQLQLIGKLMRHEDTDAIGALLEQARQEHRAISVAQQKVAESRQQLIDDDQALEAFIRQHSLDNEFRTLARRARRERAAGKDPHAQRALYRAVQKIISEQDN